MSFLGEHKEYIDKQYMKGRVERNDEERDRKAEA